MTRPVCLFSPGPEPVHPGQRPAGPVQRAGPHHRPHHDAGHQGGGGRPVALRQEDVGSRHPEALQVTSQSEVELLQVSTT